jgi:hypothetical protein
MSLESSVLFAVFDFGLGANPRSSGASLRPENAPAKSDWL